MRRLFLAVAIAVAWVSDTPAQGPRKKPNIVVILTDDQGYGDLACHGNPILKTPNLDALYAESVRFTNYHASPTCSPTRAALMTGRHEFRSGVTHTIHERERLSPHAFTLAQLLKSADYSTGIFGKWHLGDEAAYQPNRRGFDEVFIHGAGGIGQTYPGSCGDAPNNSYFNPALLHNGVFEKTKGYCTDIIFDRARDWIGARRVKPEPFFCWIAPNAPHAPLDCPPEYVRPYSNKIPAGIERGKSVGNAAKFYGMIANIDENVGKLLAQLRQWKLEDDTVVIFMTDNGGTAGVNVYNAGMRGAKVTPYEGGTRVPLFVSCPKRFPAVGDRSSLAAHIDLFPTIAELSGAKVPEKVKLDGRSLLPLLEKKDAAWEDRTLFVHVGRWDKGKAADAKYHTAAVRTARYRMVNPGQQGEAWELYDIAKDPGEKKNLAPDNPQVIRDLRGRFDLWWDEVAPLLVNEKALGPAKNPFHVLYWKQFGGEPK